MCNPCLSSSEKSEVQIFLTNYEEGGGAEVVGSVNMSFPSIDSPI